jgi:hypothetical protein
MIALKILASLAGSGLCIWFCCWLCRPVPKVELMRYPGDPASQARWRHRMELGGHFARPARVRIDPEDLMRWADDGGV